jgi:hypothetical protein
MLGADGKPIVTDIVALATFEFSEEGVQFGGLPIINGIEFACWYALLLVSRIPGKVRRCTREGCGQWYNLASTGRIGFCSDDCADEHNQEMQQRRAHNRRHPNDKREIVRTTAEKATRENRASLTFEPGHGKTCLRTAGERT